MYTYRCTIAYCIVSSHHSDALKFFQPGHFELKFCFHGHTIFAVAILAQVCRKASRALCVSPLAMMGTLCGKGESGVSGMRFQQCWAWPSIPGDLSRVAPKWMCQSVCLCVSVCACASLCMSVCVCACVCVCVCVGLSVFLVVFLSVCLSAFLL
jgi:hypothetical protein